MPASPIFLAQQKIKCLHCASGTTSLATLCIRCAKNQTPFNTAKTEIEKHFDIFVAFSISQS